MTNVETSEPDEVIKNPFDEYKVDFNVVREYMLENDFVYYKKKTKDPVRKNFKTKVFGDKDSGKTHFAHSVSQLDKRNPEISGSKKTKGVPRYSHLKFLLESDNLQPANPVFYGDSEGKADLMNRKGKFKGFEILLKDIHHPNGPLPTTGDSVAFVKEFCLQLRIIQWAHENPDEWRMIMDEKYPDVAERYKHIPPNAYVFENDSIMTNEIMNYVQTGSNTKNVDKIKAKGQELGGERVKSYNFWSLRNTNWDFIGGFTQRLPSHYLATSRITDVWKHGKPTDDKKASEYKNAKYGFNIIVWVWREKNPETGGWEFNAEIIDSDFMEEGAPSIQLQKACYLDLMAEITRYSHAEILEDNGKWVNHKKYGTIWVQNKKESDEK